MQVQNSAVPTTMERPNSAANKEVHSGKAEKAGHPSAGAEKAEQSAGKAKTENTSSYLKVLSRLENMLEKEDMPEKALEVFANAVKKRLDDAKEPDKKGVINLPEAKALELEKLDQVPEKIQESLKNKEGSEKLLSLLKHPKFVELMKDPQEQAPKTYGPQGQPAANKAKAAVPNQGAEIANSNAAPNPAMAKLKAMQANAAQQVAAQNAASATPVKQTIAAA